MQSRFRKPLRKRTWIALCVSLVEELVAQGADLAAWAACYILADGKMRAIFSMLFGAGIVLFTSRAERSDSRRAPVLYFRRTLMLMAIGMFGLVSGLLSLACHAALEPAVSLSARDAVLIALMGLGPLRGLLPPGRDDRPTGKLFEPADAPAHADLRARLEQEWIPELLSRFAIETDELPVIWDADFL